MRIRPDPFIIGIIIAAALASIFPIGKNHVAEAQVVVKVLIGVLFFFYGARLTTTDALRGVRRWKLQIAILAMTFVMFPLVGLATMPLLSRVLDKPLVAGMLLLCFLPSTVQSSITLTSLARGNIAGAVVGASLSNVLGVFLTPLLVAWFIGNQVARTHGENGFAIIAILLVPFTLGQLSRLWFSRVLDRHGANLQLFDRFALLTVVYVAFSEGVSSGAWTRIDGAEIAWIVSICMALLAFALTIALVGSRLFNLSGADRSTLTFCGAQKSLTTGLPMASILFDRADVALVILPLMLYHQMQLIISSFFAARWSRN